jgi:hypothetical protein
MERFLEIRSYDFWRNQERISCEKINKEFFELIDFVIKHHITDANLERANHRILVWEPTGFNISWPDTALRDNGSCFL